MRPPAETIAKEGVRAARPRPSPVVEDSVIYNPGLIRDDVAGCSNSSIMVTTTAPGRQIEHGRHDQPSRHLDAHDRRLWSRTICPRQERRHRGRRWRLDRYKDLAATLDNLIAQRRVPAMIAI